MSARTHINTALNQLARLRSEHDKPLGGSANEQLRLVERVTHELHAALAWLNPDAIDRSLHSDVVDAVQRYIDNNLIPIELVRELTRLCHVEHPFTLRQLQDDQRPWVAHNFPNREPWHPLLGIVEEVGELAHAHLKQAQGIRGTFAEHHEKKIDAVGDTIIYLADYCSAVGIDLHKAVETVWAEVKQRDWQAHPVDADEHAREPMPTNPETPAGRVTCMPVYAAPFDDDERDEFTPEFVVVLRNEPDGPDLGLDLSTRTWVALERASVLTVDELAGLELSGGGVITKLSTVGKVK
jgi:NTP pyrophosphatase (non-canonical NTP hydrolase)